MGTGKTKEVMKNLSATALSIPKEVQQRHTAAEEYYGDVRASLGAPGTYDLPTAVTGDPPPTVTPSAPPTPVPDSKLTRDGLTFNKAAQVKKYDKLIKKGYTKEEAMRLIPEARAADEGIFGTRKAETPGIAGGGKSNIYATEIDKDKAMKQLQGSSEYRQVSRMMAESEQLLARQGPLYDEMIRSTQLPIIEGAAAMSRENTEEIRKAMARGGTARRDAFAAVQKIRSQEQINMSKGQALAQAHMNLDMWARDNAKNVIKFADDWAGNVAGVRESYQSAMDMASDLMLSKSIPIAFMAQEKAQEYRAQASAERRNKVNNWIGNVLGMATDVLSIAAAIPTGGASTALTATAKAAASTAGGLDISNTATATGRVPGTGTQSLLDTIMDKVTG